jgi:hypothetical protein
LISHILSKFKARNPKQFSKRPNSNVLDGGFEFCSFDIRVRPSAWPRVVSVPNHFEFRFSDFRFKLICQRIKALTAQMD